MNSWFLRVHLTQQLRSDAGAALGTDLRSWGVQVRLEKGRQKWKKTGFDRKTQVFDESTTFLMVRSCQLMVRFEIMFLDGKIMFLMARVQFHGSKSSIDGFFVNGKIIYMVQVCLEGGVAHHPNMEIH